MFTTCLTGWQTLKYDEMKEDMQIRERRTGRIAVIGVKQTSHVIIVDQTGHIEILHKTDAEEWTEV